MSRLNAAVRQAVQRPDLAGRLAALGLEALDESPEAMATVIRTDAGRR